MEAVVPNQANQESRPVVFFDGVCTLCNGFVDFLMRRDSGLYLFASLQGETAKGKLDARFWEGAPTSVVLWEDGKVSAKSRAVLRILARLPGPWKLTSALRLIPAGISDLVYDFVAARRYRWFGKRDVCRVPTAEEKNRILPGVGS